MRRHYLDNIRWVTVLLVLFYHVLYIFNSVGVLGGVGQFNPVQYQDGIMYFIYPWFMVLLFAVAGMCSRYSLEKRTTKEFIKSRTLKLLVPSTIGLFVFQWIVGYFNVTIGGGWQYFPTDIPAAINVVIRYLISVVSGIGPLWFIQLLWLFSLLLILVRKIDSKDKFYNLCGKANYAVILLCALPIWGSAQILNMPILTMYRFGIYFAAFLIGYFVLSHDAVQDKIEKMHLPLLIIFVPMGIGSSIYYFGKNFTEPDVLHSIFTNIYLWIAILALLGCFKAWADKTSKFADYMSRSSFGIYIVHYLPLIISCYFLKNYTNIPALPTYIIVAATTFSLSPAIYEIIRHIPVLRYCVLGYKRKKQIHLQNLEYK